MSEYTPSTDEIEALLIQTVASTAPEGAHIERVAEARRGWHAWLTAHDAELWDEGYKAGADDQAEAEGHRYYDTPELRALGYDHWTANPYRKPA